eukprot:m.111741 g.111741  ORF g.111741 m.111741 type:complete len:162 (+) comp9242_c0_seq10:4179-4664(+)
MYWDGCLSQRELDSLHRGEGGGQAFNAYFILFPVFSILTCHFCDDTINSIPQFHTTTTAPFNKPTCTTVIRESIQFHGLNTGANKRRVLQQERWNGAYKRKSTKETKTDKTKTRPGMATPLTKGNDFGEVSTTSVMVFLNGGDSFPGLILRVPKKQLSMVY